MKDAVFRIRIWPGRLTPLTVGLAFGRRAWEESMAPPPLGWPLTLLHQALRLEDLAVEWRHIARS